MAQVQSSLLYALPLDVKEMSAVRGTIVALDQRWLQGQGLFEAYERALGAHPMVQVSATEWLRFPEALAHWRALDALALPLSTAVEAGRFVAERVHGVFLRTLAQLAGKAGFTPWMALANSHKLWMRSWQGGGVTVRREGAAKASVDLIKACVCQSRFFRASLAGSIAAGLEPFCQKVVVVARDAKRFDDSLCLDVAWV